MMNIEEAFDADNGKNSVNKNARQRAIANKAIRKEKAERKKAAYELKQKNKKSRATEKGA